MTTTSTFRRSSNSAPVVQVACSTRDDGDFHLRWAASSLPERRRSIVDLPWVQLTEPHGTDVVLAVDHRVDGAEGDIAITAESELVLGVWAADCAPLLLIGAGRELVAVHAGWRGLAGRVVQRAVEVMTEPVERAVLGPCIGPCCYEFGVDDAARVNNAVGADATVTMDATLRLDVPAAVNAALAGVLPACRIDRIGSCTGCSYPGFSHRVRRDSARHVMAVWQREVAAPLG